MRKIILCWLLAAAGVVSLAGCRGGARAGHAPDEAQDIDAVVAEVGSFTDELLRKVDSAPDVSSGVAEAQQFLDAGRAGLAAKIAAARKGREFQAGGDARGKMMQSEVESVTRVSGLRTRHISRAMSDPDFKAKLDRLVGDYQELFKD